MRHGAVSANIKKPIVGIRIRDPFLFHSLQEYIVAFLALAAADNFPHPGHQHIHRPDGFPVIVEAHVESLYLFRIVVNDDRLLEGLLGQIALVLRLQLKSPFDRIFKLFARGL